MLVAPTPGRYGRPVLQIPDSMTTLSYNTVGLLFPAISLLMLAYTNRFLGLASLVRGLIARHEQQPSERVALQIESLSHRLSLIRHTQALGVSSLIFCVASLFLLFLNTEVAAQIAFALALLCMLASLLLSLREIQMSVRALQIEIEAIRKVTPAA